MVISTENGLLAAPNSPDSFVLAAMRSSIGLAQQPVYVHLSFARELGFAETAVSDMNKLLSLGTVPA